jgi:DNA (cytosine-5)-methyltransferase 1
MKRRRSSSKPIAVDLFSGAGGLSLGLEQAGFNVAAAIENSSGPARTHQSNFPHIPVLERDIRSVAASDIWHAIGQESEVALVSGGPPCQGFSTGGIGDKRDLRNSLVHEFRRMVVALNARYFLMENVPGLLFLRHASVVAQLQRAFRRAGYEMADPILIDARRIGLPQRRIRVLLLGWKRGERAPDLENLGRKDRQCVTVGDAIGDLENVSLERDQTTYSGDPSSISTYAKGLRKRIIGHSVPRLWNPKVLTGCSPTSHSADVLRRFRRTPPGGIEPISRFRRLNAHEYAPTLRAGTGPEHGSHTPPRPIHYSAARVITVREAARLQSFPDWFRFAPTKWHAWQEIGNSVPPLLSRAIGERILNSLL